MRIDRIRGREAAVGRESGRGRLVELCAAPSPPAPPRGPPPSAPASETPAIAAQEQQQRICDYFVFKSGTAGAFSFNICFGTGLTNVAATLWKVANGQQVTPPIHQWSSSSSCVQTAAGDAMLDASTVYLFRVQATGAGMYSA